MKILFIASVSIISPNPAESRKLYVDALDLPLKPHEGSDYYMSEEVEGSKHFGVWPLSEAAKACFGTEFWPVDRPIPQSSVEFEVRNSEEVQAASDELKQKGFTLLHDARTEPWGQTVARLQAVEGNIIGISFAPWLH